MNLNLIVNITGLVLILFVIWWFWLAKFFIARRTKTVASDTIDIIVDNGVYNPAIVKIKAGEKIQLRFFRKDPAPCAEWVIFESLNISDQLPINKPHNISLKIDTPGEYPFTCQMNMYRGRLIVE